MSKLYIYSLNCLGPFMHIQSIQVFHMLLLYFTLGDLYGKINSQRGILFPEEQVCIWNEEFWIILEVNLVYYYNNITLYNLCIYNIMFKGHYVMIISQKLSILSYWMVLFAFLDCSQDTPLKLLLSMFDHTLYPVVFSTDHCCNIVWRWWTGLFRSA